MSFGALAVLALLVCAILAVVLFLLESELGAILGGGVCAAAALGYGVTMVIVVIGGQAYGPLELILASAQFSVMALILLLGIFIGWRLRRDDRPTSSE